MIHHPGSMAVCGGYLGFVDGYGVAIGCNTEPPTPLREIGKWILALMMGEEPDENPYFLRKRRIETIIGEYESYGGIKKAVVEKIKILLKVIFIERSWNQSVMLIPKTKTIDNYEFYYIGRDDEKYGAEFMIGEDDEIDLYIDNWILHKIQ